VPFQWPASVPHRTTPRQGYLAEADAYFAARFFSGEGWSGFTEPAKAARLWQAAVYIDRLQFVGKPTYDNQKRAWPRRPLYEIGYQSVLRVLGKAISRDEIPEAIKYAQAELADVILNEDGNVIQPAASTVRSETLGKWSIAYQQYVTPLLACPPALDYLYPFLVESSRIERE